MARTVETLRRIPADRLAELVAAGVYGTVLVLAALSVIGVADVSVGYGAELVFGVGVATWVAHLFAELLGGHVVRQRPLERRELVRATADGCPILVSTVLPACVLLLGRLDAIPETVARTTAIVVAVAQLLVMGYFVGQIAPARRWAAWIFGAVTVGMGVVVVALTTLLGH